MFVKRKIVLILVLILALIISVLFFVLPKKTSAQSTPSSGGLADSAWPMLLGNVRHTGLSTYDTGSVDGAIKWTFEAGEGIESSPVISTDGTIYFGAHDNKFYAVNPDGTLKWKFNAGDPIYSAEWNVYKGITSTAAIDKNGIIYFVSMSNFLFALNPDGSEKWRYVVHDFVNSWLAPVIGSDGTIYVGSENYPPGGKQPQEVGGRFYALNPDGTLKWKHESNAAGFGNYAAIGADGTIYAAGGDWEEFEQTFVSKLLAFNPDGTIKWKFRADSVIEGSPTIANDSILYLGTKNGKFFALDSNGNQKWVFQTGDGISAVAAIGSDATIYIGSWDRYFYALNPDGTLKWKFETPAGFEAISSSAAIGSDGTIYFGHSQNGFYALNPDGSEKWHLTNPKVVVTSPAIGSDGTIYFGSWDKKLYAIGKKEETTNEETSSTPVETKKEIAKEESKVAETPVVEPIQPTQSQPITVTPIKLTDDQSTTNAVLIWAGLSILLTFLFWLYRNKTKP